MGKYTCNRCAKEFTQKSHYTVHKSRKIPCENNVEKIKSIVNEKLKELNIKELNIKEETTIELSENNPVAERPYSKLSYDVTKELGKKEKQEYGIYFTPPKTIKECIKYLGEYIDGINTVLEPSCGTCEYILELSKEYSNLDITGIEYNKSIYDKIKGYENNKIKIKREDYLLYKNEKNYDLIIGNPPYFVMKKNEIDKSYYDYFDGRPNIFILFIIKALSMLNKNGILLFILPKNFLNCLYYNKTRRHIYQNYKILNIVECNDNYIETKQDTIIFMLQNKMDVEHNNKYTLNINNYTIFCIDNKLLKIKHLYENSTTLYSLKFKVNVGNVVWNQCKDILTDDETKTRLIYSSDISKNKLIKKDYENKEKKNYINKEGLKEPMVIMNRGYGVGKYKFEYCLIEGEKEYLLENHIICIKYTEIIEEKKLIELYKKIIKSLESKKTQQFIDLYFGNNAVNTTELCEIIPIYDMND